LQNGCMDQDVTWYGGRPRPRPHCTRWGPRSPPQKGEGICPPPNFRPMSIVAKRLDGWIKMPLGIQMGTQFPLPPKGHSSQFSAHVCCCKMAAWIKISLGMEVGLGPGHIVLDGNPAPPPQKGGTAPSIFGPCLLWPSGWMDQDAIILVLTLTSSWHQIHTHGVHQLCFSRLSQLFTDCDQWCSWTFSCPVVTFQPVNYKEWSRDADTTSGCCRHRRWLPDTCKSTLKAISVQSYWNLTS